MRNHAGVTLIEMLFGIAVVAILAGLAAPGFRQSLRATAVRVATYELLGGLQQTRGSSIIEARPGMLCPSDAAGHCLPAATPAAFWHWSTETGTNPALEPRALPEGIVARASRSPIRFWPHALAASTATLTICDLQGVAPPRAIVVNVSGRARVTAAADSACR
ncbi:MAG TPA: GspH/FimT family pseudopilin [Burkholderiaceae bacterium]|nr:GspH/FimT family pseudopilin [Burkholderiaceae bacterium]